MSGVEGWELYEAPGGGDVVAREIRKAGLTATEVARMEAAMVRVHEGRTRPGDFKQLRGEVREVRVRVGPRQLRLYFAHPDGRRLCLGLVFLLKKTQKAPPDALDLAEQRLRQWRRSHGQ